MIFRLPKVDGNPSAVLPPFARLSLHFVLVSDPP